MYEEERHEENHHKTWCFEEAIWRKGDCPARSTGFPEKTES